MRTQSGLKDDGLQVNCEPTDHRRKKGKKGPGQREKRKKGDVQLVIT
jgi:hypothetical protein